MTRHYDDFMKEYTDDMRPQPALELAMDRDELDDGQIVLLPIFSGDKFIETVNYPVIVEMWKNIFVNGNRKIGGRVGRAFKEQFTEAERKMISKWHTKFYRWYLVTGTPRKVAMRLKTVELLQRAVAFFGTI